VARVCIEIESGKGKWILREGNGAIMGEPPPSPPFYMSYNQQNLVRISLHPEKHGIANNHSLGPGALKWKTLPPQIFIFRVFNIKERPGLHIYLNPWKLFVRGLYTGQRLVN
jgi:hypothetical protein